MSDATAGDCIEADWPLAAPVRALSTTRRMPGVSSAPYDRCNLGARSGDASGNVECNRRQLMSDLALPSCPIWLKQVHATRVLTVEQPLPMARAIDDEPEADAAVAHHSGIVLAVLSADCLPVAFAAADGSAIGLAHAGWRGLAAGVLERTVAAMGLPATQVMAWLGPAIGPAHYEVGEEVRLAFTDADVGAATAFARTRPGHWRCDLYALARRRLETAGVSRVYGGGFDTFGDSARFYSYRRDGARSGRQATLIWRSGSELSKS